MVRKLYYIICGVLFVRIIENIYLNFLKYRLTKYPMIDKSVKFGNRCKFSGLKNNLIIGKNTYINEAHIFAGEKSLIKIGKNCSIGYKVSIKSITHGQTKVFNDEIGNHDIVEKDITIGNRCWIGDGVFIKEGVVLGNDVIVGANSVVTKCFDNNLIIAGIPAKIIKIRD